MKKLSDLRIDPQPNDSSCGPTCLHAVYRHLGIEIELSDLVHTIQPVAGGGTIAANLGIDALNRGFKAHLHCFDLRIFDPSWFELNRLELASKVRQTLPYQTGKLQACIQAHLEFLELGGTIGFGDLNPSLLGGYIKRQIPVIAGVSASWLYRSPREREEHGSVVEDDIAGRASGHFVVVTGYRSDSAIFTLSDPWPQRRFESQNLSYEVSTWCLYSSILLGVESFDGNLLVIENQRPPENL